MRIAPQGRVRLFPLQRNLGPHGLAFDRYGHMWIKGTHGNGAIGRVGTGLKVRLFPIPTRNAGLHRIISGPGGNMWFTEMNEDKVGYITTGRGPITGASGWLRRGT